MEIVIRKYEEKDLCAMIEIWNEIVEEGNAFPQEEFLTLENGADFLQSKPIRVLQLIVKQKKYTDYIFYIRTISEDAVISVMQAMQ